jgi:hypothetical protein
MRCGVSRRNPIFEDGECHSCINQAGIILNLIVGRAEKSCGEELKRDWLCVGLDLVTLVNETTDFDELGFESVFRLCLAVRRIVVPARRSTGGQKAANVVPDHHSLDDEAFRHQMKLEYLAAMKLTRDVIAAANGLCGRCLSDQHSMAHCPKGAQQQQHAENEDLGEEQAGEWRLGVSTAVNFIPQAAERLAL